MKKTISIFVSIILSVITIFCVSLSAFAETTTKYWEPRPDAQSALSYVNGEIGGNIYVESDPQTGGCKITYDDNGRLIGWEFPLLEEGKDYKIISQSDNSITIKLMNENHELPYINALVEFNETTASAKSDEYNSQITATKQEDTTQKTNTTIQSHTNTPINNIQPESNNKNTNKIIIPCIIGVCILIIIFIITKKHKH